MTETGQPAENSGQTVRPLVRGLLLIAALVGIGFAVKASGLATALDEAWIDSAVRGQGWHGWLLFVAAGALFTGAGLPRQIVSFLGGYAFGLVLGSLLAVIATTASCIVTFGFARLLGRKLITARFPRQVRRIDEFLKHGPLLMTLLIRLLPVGNNLVVNLTAGVTGVSAAAFVVGSAIGYLPQTIVFALVGSGVNVDGGLRITVGIVLFIVSGVLGAYLYRRYRRARRLDSNGDDLAAAEPAGSGPGR